MNSLSAPVTEQTCRRLDGSATFVHLRAQPRYGVLHQSLGEGDGTAGRTYRDGTRRVAAGTARAWRHRPRIRRLAEMLAV